MIFQPRCIKILTCHISNYIFMTGDFQEWLKIKLETIENILIKPELKVAILNKWPGIKKLCE